MMATHASRLRVAILWAGLAVVSCAWPQALVNPEAPRETAAQQASAALERLSYRPDPYGVAGVERTLRAAPDIVESSKAQAHSLVTEAVRDNALGHGSAALSLLYQAIDTLQGKEWSTRQTFLDSLVLDNAVRVMDAQSTLQLVVKQDFPAPAPAADRFSIKLSIQTGTGAPAPAPLYLGTFQLDTSASPVHSLHLSIPLPTALAGAQTLVADVYAADQQVARLKADVTIVPGLVTARSQVEQRLAKMSGHPDAVATIRYPFSLATDWNEGHKSGSYDFASGILRSLNLLNQLEAGQDPIYQAKGDTQRAYYLPEAQDIIPFRVFVPDNWRPGQSLPMIVALHGANLDENNFLTRGDSILKRLAQQRGYIVLCPLGYRLNHGYGSILPAPADEFGLIDDVGNHSALSELDVMRLTRAMAREYGVDRHRIYLLGNSMGGMGTWYLGAKHPEEWAALAPAAGGVNDPDFDFKSLKAMPILAVAGELDGTRVGVKATAERARANGASADYLEVAGGTHGTAVEMAMPQILDFFAQHRREQPASATESASAITAIRDVRIFTGEHVLPAGVVLFSHGLIRAVGTHVSIPAGAKIIEGRGKTLLPGLIDAHVHVVDGSPGGVALEQAAVYGITTVFDLGTSNPFDYTYFKARVNAGVYPGTADLFSAGPPATAPGGHGDMRHLNPTLTAPSQAADWVADRVAAGSDYIKIISETFEEHGRHVPSLSDDTISAVVDAAHREGKLAIIHTLQQARARRAVLSGVDGLAHISPYDSPDADFGRFVAAHHVFQSTNLISYAPPQVKIDLASDPLLAPYMPASMIAGLKASRAFPDSNHAYSIAALKELHGAGVKIIAGTDIGYPYAPLLHAEIDLMVRDGGLTPIEALQSATANPVAAYRLADRGLIEAGRRADLLLVDGDPTQHITDTRRIVQVWVAGQPIDRASYQRRMESLPLPPEMPRPAAPAAAKAEAAVPLPRADNDP